MNNKVRVLVTGASGFIGQHLCRSLTESNHEVIALSRSKPKSNKIYKKYFHGNILNSHDIDTATKNCQIIFHLACLPLIAAKNNPRLAYENNVLGTFNVLDAANKNRCKRVVFTSTAQVVGLGGNKPIKENIRCSPISNYGSSKLCAEILCETTSRKTDTNIVILRLFNVYGRSLDKKERTTIDEIFIRALLNNQSPTITGNKNNGRDFIHINDVITALSIFSDPINNFENGVYNIGTGRLTTIYDLSKLISKMIGNDIQPIISDEINAGDAIRLHADTKKTERCLGFKANIPLENGLRSLISSYINE